MREYRHHTKEFKLSVLNELNFKTAVQIAREHNIHPVVISRWKKEFNDNPKKAFSGKGNVCHFESEIARRDKAIAELYLQNELLKKTAERLQQLKEEEKIMRRTK